jgi:hypothetical protein
VDYYGLIGDVERRLGLPVITVPWTIWQFLIDEAIKDPIQALKELRLKSADDDLPKLVLDRFKASLPEDLGLRPEK